MSNNDPLISAAELRGRQLFASRKRAEADLAMFVADGDEANIADTLGEIAGIDAQGAALNRLHDQHVAANTYSPPPESDSEWRAKSAEKMGGNDALKIINYGKHQSDPTWLSAEDYNKQQRELIRLKAQGMYKE